MTADERDEELLRRLSVLAEPVRMKILRLLSANKSLRAKDLLEEFSVTQPTLSHHMNTLIEADLVRAQKDGRCIWYSINMTSIQALSSLLSELTEGNPVISTERKAEKAPKATTLTKAPSKNKPALKVESSVPKPKTVLEIPDIEELKKKKDKKKKSSKKKKDKDKDKKKKK